MFAQFFGAENSQENTHINFNNNKQLFRSVDIRSRTECKTVDHFCFCVCFHMAFVGCEMHLKMNVDAFNGLVARGMPP